MEILHQNVIVLTNPDQREVCTKRASDASRYTPQGIEKIKKKIRERLKAYPATFGVLLTLTVADPNPNQKHYQGKPKLEAWRTINKLAREFSDELNKSRKRQGLKKVRAFVKVLEIQPGREYPHVHIYFPGLKWLAPTKVLQRIWPYGNVDVGHTDSSSPSQYLAKYLSKMNGRDFMNVMLFIYHLRLYSNSKGLRYATVNRHNTGWQYSSAGTRLQSEANAVHYIEAGYSLVGQISITPRGP